MHAATTPAERDLALVESVERLLSRCSIGHGPYRSSKAHSAILAAHFGTLSDTFAGLDDPSSRRTEILEACVRVRAALAAFDLAASYIDSSEEREWVRKAVNNLIRVMRWE
jgi:hypothetical protein